MDAELSQQLKRRSQRAAVLSLAGVVVVGVSLAWSAFHLGQFDQKIQEKQSQITNLETQDGQLRSQLTNLIVQQKTLEETAAKELAKVRVLTDSNQALSAIAREMINTQKQLRAETATAKSNLERAVAEAAANEQRLTNRLALLQAKVTETEKDLEAKEDALKQKQQELASFETQYKLANKQWEESLRINREQSSASTLQLPVSALVKPKASANRVAANTYDCKLWLDVPEKRRNEIARVTYKFNHASFNGQPLESSDSSTGFAVGYRGWGAFRLIIIEIQLKSGQKSQIAFDMAGALGLAGSPAPGKVPFEPGVPDGKIPFEDLTRKSRPL